MALFRADQVRELDRIAIEEAGIPGATLMERAGHAAFELLRELWPRARRVAVLCGVGNNGGDGFVVARLARHAGMVVTVFEVGDTGGRRGDAKTAAEAFVAEGGSTRPFDHAGSLSDHDVLVDALLGTGLRGEVSSPWRDVIDAMNHSTTPVLAVDIPSGLSADTGRVLGSAVRAQATISFIGLKQGLFTGDGPEVCGRVYYDGLRVPAAVITRIRPAASRITLAALHHRLARRSRSAHKGEFGHVLVVGGGVGMAGAARLAGDAALRVGAGLVSVATRPEHAAQLSGARPELMCHPVADAGVLSALLTRASVIAVGPGLGRSAWARELLGAVLEAHVPVVADADALNLLAEDPVSRHDWILTPHPGEAARLLGVTVADIQADRFAAVRALQKRYGGVCILKGTGTIVSSGVEPVGVCCAGNPGMASAGMGDILTGVTAGLLGQQHDAEVSMRITVAARLGVCVHALAGDAAALDGERGMIASDVLTQLREIVNP